MVLCALGSKLNLSWNKIFSYIRSGYHCTVAGLCEQGKGPQGALSTDRPATTELGDRNGEATPGGDGALSGSPEKQDCVVAFIIKLNFCCCFLTGHSQQHIGDDHRTRSGNLSGRTSSQTNVYLDTFGYQDNSRAFDTLSVDSSDSMETSISACSPDNVSR